MCLVAIAWRAHARYPLIVAGNRDEFHERPSAAGGLVGRCGAGLRRSRPGGRRQLARRQPQRPVRGRHQQPAPPAGPGTPGEPRTPGARLRRRRQAERPLSRRRAGRTRSATQASACWWARGCRCAASSRRAARTRAAGRCRRACRSSATRRWSRPWPKVGYLESAMRDLLSAADVELGTAVRGAGPARAGWRRRRTVARGEPHALLVGERYGTRATTVVTMDAEGCCEFEERRFDAAGRRNRDRARAVRTGKVDEAGQVHRDGGDVARPKRINCSVSVGPPPRADSP